MVNQPQKFNSKEISTRVKEELAELLDIDATNIQDDTSFMRLGLSSVDVIRLASKLSEFIGRDIQATDLYDYSNVAELSDFIAESSATATVTPTQQDADQEAIAIVAMACIFPEAENVEEYWDNLINKKDCITAVPADRWDPEEVLKGRAAGNIQIKYGGFIKDPDLFDAAFFHISPREAELMDPQQRILLEQTQVLCESAGYNIDSLKGQDVGVFIGISQSNYSELINAHSDERNIYIATGNALSVAANRISYVFDFQGPSVAVDTACSSSLVAVHQAVRAIRSGECSMAVAGGVNLILTPYINMCFSDAGLMASDGHCKTFDAAANGIARSEGCGLVMLKPLSKALADGDEVIALVKGSAVNQDGLSNGLTAPNGLSQQRLMQVALKDAALQPSDVQYVETHGTGTYLGDPIEAHAIGKVYGEKNGRKLLLGAAKANLGHLESAAGIAGIIKAALVVKHRKLPGQINYDTPNTQIRWAEYNLGVETDTTELSSNQLNAGVSSFGFGGTNAHIILGSYQQAVKDTSTVTVASERSTHMLPLSAVSANALKQRAVQVLQLIDEQPQVSLADISRTYSIHKTHYSNRVGLTAKTPEQLKEALRAFVQGEEHSAVFTKSIKVKQRKIAFLFTGAGSQYAGMGKAFYASEPAFAAALDACFKAAAKHMDTDLKSVMFCTPGSDEEKLLNRIDLMQPAIFAFEYAMSKWWETLGIIPEMVIGHSLGEIVAACISGVFDLEDAMRLTILRGQLILNMPEPGTMASIQAPEEEVLKFIEGKEDRVAVGVLNGRNQSVVSGRVADVEAVVAHFDAKGVKTKILNIARAGHSPLMDQICEPFRDVLKTFSMGTGHIPLVGNTTGQVAGDEIKTPQYWVDHLRKTVRFADGLHTLIENDCDVLLEVGPQPTLLGIARFEIDDKGDFLYLPSAMADDMAMAMPFDSAAKYYSHGGNINWKSFLGHAGGKRIATAPYPFQRSRYWIEKRSGKSLSGMATTGAPVLQTALKVAGNLRVYELSLSAKNFPYLLHHSILDTSIVPSSFLLEMAMEYLALNNKAAVIEHLEFQSPLFMEDGVDTEVQLHAKADPGTHQTGIEVYSFNPAKQDWLLHLKATAGEGASAKEPDLNIADTKASLKVDGQIDAFYKSLEQKGLKYGENFKTLREVYTSDRESLALVSLGETIAEETLQQGYQLHPTLIEAAMQLLLHREKQNTDLFQMLTAEKVHVHKAIGAKAWVSLRPMEVENRYQVKFFDTEGQFLAGFTFEARQATAAQMSSSGSRLRTDWMFEPFWKPHAVDGFIPKIQNWLIVCNDNKKELYAPFFDSLEQKEISHSVFKDWATALKAMNEEGFDYMTVFWDDQDYKANDPGAANRAMALAGLGQLQALNKLIATHNDLILDTIHWVTEGFSQGTRSLPVSSLWAIGRTFVRESVTNLKMVDVNPKDLDAKALMKNLISLENENEARMVGDKVEVHRLRKRSISADKPTKLSENATYIVTGGLSGLGLLAAKWMSEHTSVKQVALWARSGPSDDALQTIEEIKANGTSVLIQQVDVADAQRVEAAMAEANDAFPVKGIVHAAGLISYAMIDDQNAKLLDEVSPPKVQGTWNLHQSSKKYELENFIIFSSFSAMPGLPGVANYSIANNFCDQLANIRSASGLPCCSINWGSGSAVTGMLSADRVGDFEKYMAQRGLGLLDPEQGMNLFGYALEHQLSGARHLFAPLFLDDSGPFRLPSGKVAPIFRDLFDDIGSAEELELNLKVILAHASPDDRPKILAAAIRQQVVMIAKLEDPSGMDDDDDFSAFGLDSLMAAELVGRLSRMLKTNLSSTVVFDHRSVGELTNWLVNKKLDFESEAELSADEQTAIDNQISELTGEAAPAPVAAVVSNGTATAMQKEVGPDWNSILQSVIVKELEQHGLGANEIEKNWQLRRRLNRLVSSLRKKTES